MAGRRDAGLAAASFAVAVNALVVQEFPDCVATIGDMAFHPGGFNVIPRAARVSLEFRSLDATQLTRSRRRCSARRVPPRSGTHSASRRPSWAAGSRRSWTSGCAR